MTRREFLPAVAGFVTLSPAEDKPSLDGSVPRRSSPPSFTPVDAVPLGKTPPGAVILHHHWQMREEALVGNHGEEFSRARFSDTRDWYATTVPTTVLGTLIRHGLYPDPYIGLNNLQIPDASLDHSRRYHLDQYSHLRDGSNPWSQPYWFRTQFSLPESFQGKTVFLHFDGINYRADRNVTQYCTIGWDWVPASRDRNVGLWQHVWLEGTGVVAVRDPAAFVERLSTENREALLTIKVQLQNTAPEALTVDLRVRLEPDGFPGDPLAFRSRQTVPPGTEQEITLHPGDHPELILHNPVLWWPVGYGAPALYRLTVEAWIDGQLSSSSVSHVGIRTVGTYLLPSGGRAFTVNGKTIRLAGGAWVPDFLLSWSAQRYRDEVRLMAEGNHTVVRVNGCGIMPPDVFFDECDRRGLLVWQDFSRTSIAWEARKDKVHSNDPLPCDAALLLANMKDCVVRLRSHPSLLLWCGCNEATPQADFGQPMQDQILPALDPLRLWLPSSGSDPSWEREPVHTWSGGPYELVPLARYFRLYETGTSSTCKNEIGLASPPPSTPFAAPFQASVNRR
jgi:Glycosyl hydrolases family 2